MLLLAGSAQAAPLSPLACGGTEPGWSLTIEGEDAELGYLYASGMTVMHHVRPEGRDWPIAMTLIGREDTAVLIVDERACQLGEDDLPLSATVLTQRDQTPIVLVGCCAPPR